MREQEKAAALYQAREEEKERAAKAAQKEKEEAEKAAQMQAAAATPTSRQGEGRGHRTPEPDMSDPAFGSGDDQFGSPITTVEKIGTPKTPAEPEQIPASAGESFAEDPDQPTSSGKTKKKKKKHSQESLKYRDSEDDEQKRAARKAKKQAKREKKKKEEETEKQSTDTGSATEAPALDLTSGSGLMRPQRKAAMRASARLQQHTKREKQPSGSDSVD